MREVSRDAFDKLERALVECLPASTTLGGLKLAPPAIDAHQIEFAAVSALTVLFGDYVRPQGVKFVDRFGDPTAEYREW